jgi:hypothetical protein
MKIGEIIGGTLANTQIPPTQDLGAAPIEATVDGYDIHAFSYDPLFDIVLAVLNGDGTYRGYIGLNDDGHFIEAYTKEEHRKQGIMSVLMLYALRNFKTPLYILHGDIVSKFSRQAIWSLAEKNKIIVKNKNGDAYTRDILLDILNNNWPNEHSLYLYPSHGALKENYWEFRDVETGAAYYDKNFLGEEISPWWYD